jgi:hypothetical protein
LIVPLSWFIVQFILSISSILTIVMLNLPFDTFENFENEVSKVEVPTNCSINLSSKNE